MEKKVNIKISDSEDKGKNIGKTVNLSEDKNKDKRRSKYAYNDKANEKNNEKQHEKQSGESNTNIIIEEIPSFKKRKLIKRKNTLEMSIDDPQEEYIPKLTQTSKSTPHDSKYNELIKPYMNHLGILKFNAILLSYYSGRNKIYLIETDYLETFVLKIYSLSAYKYKASIEKHFITNAKNISKLTPNINVAHDSEEKLSQFLFTDRMAGANKKWDILNADEKSSVIKEIGKVLFKIHTYSSKRTLKEDIFGLVSNPNKSWVDYLYQQLKTKAVVMKNNGTEISKILKFEKEAEQKIKSLESLKITPVLLHGSINLNSKGIIRSLLFLGTKISAVLNSEESIYGDRLWDIAKLHNQVLSQDSNIEKDFFNEYGKLKLDEKLRLEFYKEII